MRKIAIVGTAPNTLFEAPYHDKSWEIWSLNGAFERIPRYDLWFEFHSWQHCLEEKLQPAYYANLLKTASEGKLYTIEPFPDHPNPRIFPKQEVANLCGEYFTSSVAWMLALAIYEEATEIGLWGINMEGSHEYRKQRACCEYLLGFAKGRGIKITLPTQCPLLKGSLYCSELGIELQTISDKAEEEYNKYRDNMNYNRGIADAVQKLQHKWG